MLHTLALSFQAAEQQRGKLASPVTVLKKKKQKETGKTQKATVSLGRDTSSLASQKATPKSAGQKSTVATILPAATAAHLSSGPERGREREDHFFCLS